MDSVVLVIDPQKGFTSPDGTLARAYGAAQLARIAETVARLAARLPALAQTSRTAVVTSEYRPHRFDPAPDGPLSQLCVPGPSLDCEIDDALASFPFDRRFVKTEKSALSCDAFLRWAPPGPGTRFLLCGFLTEHCVLETALALQAAAPGQVVVLGDLVASRIAHYGPDGAVEKALLRLREAAVEIV